MKNIIKITSLITVVLVLVGCEVTNTKVFREDIDFHNYFSGLSGAFKIYDVSSDNYLTYNEEDIMELDSPASTFKILHSLIALETKVLNYENSRREWDGTTYPIEEWNKDHTLKTAVQSSVVWYFQEIAREIGKGEMQYYLDKTDYGNKKIGNAVDEFWLDDSLKISAQEQLNFITNLYKDELPFSKINMKIVKDILINEKSDLINLSGKTGSFEVKGKPSNSIGWFIGYITYNEKTYTFVTKIKGDSATGWKAKNITKQILKDLELYK